MSDEEFQKMINRRLKITYVGHSLGGMALMIYLIESKLRGE